MTDQHSDLIRSIPHVGGLRLCCADKLLGYKYTQKAGCVYRHVSWCLLVLHGYFLAPLVAVTAVTGAWGRHLAQRRVSGG
jgi:hypothetical protein